MKMLKATLKSIRQVLISVPIINNLVYEGCRYRSKKNCFRASQKIVINNQLQFSALFEDNALPSNKACHIIGSGYSLNKSSKFLKDDDFIIGFNFAGMIKLKYNIYFVELASKINEKLENISHCQYNVVSENYSNQQKLIFKNIYSEAVPQSEYLSKYVELNVLFARDYQIPILSKTLLGKSVSSLLDEKDISLLPQLRSTIYTAVGYAYRLGYQEIVLHGLDFGGPHFFDAEDFTGTLDNRPSYEALPKINIGENHLTNMGEVSSIDILKEINKQLKNKGVTLYAAIESSKLSHYLPVYYAEGIR